MSRHFSQYTTRYTFKGFLKGFLRALLFLTVLLISIWTLKDILFESELAEFQAQVEQLEDEINSAYQDGYDNGYEEGYSCGFYEGQDLVGLTNNCTFCDSSFIADTEIPYGLCYDCWRKNIDNCAFCFSETIKWSNNLLFTVCPNCLGEASATTDLDNFLINFNENR